MKEEEEHEKGGGYDRCSGRSIRLMPVTNPGVPRSNLGRGWVWLCNALGCVS